MPDLKTKLKKEKYGYTKQRRENSIDYVTDARLQRYQTVKQKNDKRWLHEKT